MESRTRKKRIWASYRYCFARLVLQLWLFYEESLDNVTWVSGKDKAFGEELTQIMRRFLEESQEDGAKEAFERLKGLRDRIIGRVEILTAFSDCFQIYEYVLNRVERRFAAGKPSRHTPRELASLLVESMASMESPAERNGRLRDITAQLPVRFTRKKFYSMVMERLSSYGGLNRENVEDYLHMLKSSVMLKLPQGMEEERELYKQLECLCQAQYRNLEREDFDRCANALGEGTRLLSAKMDYYVSVQQMVNDLYVLFLTDREKVTDAVEDMKFRSCTENILDALQAGDGELLGTNEIPREMEGIQESVIDLVMAAGAEKDPILDQVDRLVSGSLFMPAEAREACHQEADRQWLNREGEKLCEELEGLFTGMQKAVVRAVMAKVISSLPIVFRDSREVEEYICTSLESCTDAAEREASMELLENELT